MTAALDKARQDAAELDAAKQRIAELEAIIAASMNVEPNVQLMLRLARKEGFLECQRQAVEEVKRIAASGKGDQSMLLGVIAILGHVEQAISKLKPEGE